ncbi:hypothetical protein J6590_065495 [Homalodisca vitripennis]|nr:hypothetical protein J6590_065495 [Homalodisca vitripennis]
MFQNGFYNPNCDSAADRKNEIAQQEVIADLQRQVTTLVAAVSLQYFCDASHHLLLSANTCLNNLKLIVCVAAVVLTGDEESRTSITRMFAVVCF